MSELWIFTTIAASFCDRCENPKSRHFPILIHYIIMTTYVVQSRGMFLPWVLVVVVPFQSFQKLMIQLTTCLSFKGWGLLKIPFMLEPACKVHGCKVFSDVTSIFAQSQSKSARLGYNPNVRSAHLYGQFSLDKTLTLQAGATVPTCTQSYRGHMLKCSSKN